MGHARNEKHSVPEPARELVKAIWIYAGEEGDSRGKSAVYKTLKPGSINLSDRETNRVACLMQYLSAAILGAWLWGLLGLAFSDSLFRVSFEGTSVLAGLAFMLLLWPSVWIAMIYGWPPVGALPFINGFLWGLVVLYIYRKLHDHRDKSVWGRIKQS